MNKLQFYFHFVPKRNGFFSSKRHMELPYPKNRVIEPLLGSSIHCYPTPTKSSSGEPPFIVLQNKANKTLSKIDLIYVQNKLYDNDDVLIKEEIVLFGCARLRETQYTLLVQYNEHSIHMFVGDADVLGNNIHELINDGSIPDEMNLLMMKHNITQKYLGDYATRKKSYIPPSLDDETELFEFVEFDDE